MKRSLPVVMTVLAALLSTAASAQDFAEERLMVLLEQKMQYQPVIPKMTTRLLAKAKPDECYAGIGLPYPELAPNGTCSEGIPKTNQAYVWGLTLARNKLFFGTVANVLCQVGSVLGASTMESSSVACEGSQAASGTGDWRMPRIYRYDLGKNRLAELTPASGVQASGLRSAGSLGDVVFLAGPLGGSILGGGAIQMFAYDAVTETLLGSHIFTEFNDIRKWLVYKGVLYTGVQKTAGGGAILRWRGDRNNLWAFEVVGNLPNAAANIALYGSNRIAASTWPSIAGVGAVPAGIVLGPVVPNGGLTASYADQWRSVFSFGSYEPDPVVLATYAGGDLAYYGGWLYWGSMHVPGLSLKAHHDVFGANASQSDEDALLGTWRATSVWRGRKLDTANPQIQLLYGESELPKYDFNPRTGQGSKTFVMAPTGWTGGWGRSGFDNAFNSYLWTMAVAGDALYMGTFDMSYLLNSVELDELIPGMTLPPMMMSLSMGYGADIWRLDSNYSRPVLETKAGAGNQVNYGIRTMQPSVDGNTLYIGTANPFNLDPKGGWELLSLRPRSR